MRTVLGAVTWACTSWSMPPAASRNCRGCEADAVHGHVHGRRIAVQVLADHENRLAMGISAGAEDRDVGGESNISRDLSPHKVEIIGREPHVFAAAADRIGSAGAVILGGAGVEDSAHVLLAFKDDQRPGDDVRRRCAAGLRNQLRTRRDNANGDDCKCDRRQQGFLRHGRPFENSFDSDGTWAKCTSPNGGVFRAKCGAVLNRKEDISLSRHSRTNRGPFGRSRNPRQVNPEPIPPHLRK